MPTPPDEHTLESRPVLLICGIDEAGFETLARRFEPQVRVVRESDDADVLSTIGALEPAVVCVGGEVGGSHAPYLVETALERFPQVDTTWVISGAGPDLARFQELIDASALFWLSRRPLDDEARLVILRSALESRQRRADAVARILDVDELPRIETALDLARRVAIQEDLETAAELVSEALPNLVGGERAHCLLYDPIEEVLWSRGPEGMAERRESAAVGIVSFVARTGHAVVIRRIGDSLHYERQADDPRGSGEERFLALPVRDSFQVVLAVLAVVRGPTEAPFSDGDVSAVRILADLVSSTFKQLVLRSQLDARASSWEEELMANTPFRREAVEDYASGLRDEGEVLRLSPRWMSWTYYSLLLLIVAAAVLATVGTAETYVRGPAVVRVASDGAAIVALLPFDPAVRLQPGGRLFVDFPAADSRAVPLTISAVGESLTQPADAPYILGRGIPPAFDLSQPTVRVVAELPAAAAPTGEIALEDGAPATVRVPAGAERILFVLFPNLKKRWQRLING